MTAPVILVLSPFQEKLKLKIKITDIRENQRDEDNEINYLHMKAFCYRDNQSGEHQRCQNKEIRYLCIVTNS